MFKSYVNWCNKITTLYAAFGFSAGMTVVNFGTGQTARLPVDLVFASLFLAVICLRSYKP